MVGWVPPSTVSGHYHREVGVHKRRLTFGCLVVASWENNRWQYGTLGE